MNNNIINNDSKENVVETLDIGTSNITKKPKKKIPVLIIVLSTSLVIITLVVISLIFFNMNKNAKANENVNNTTNQTTEVEEMLTVTFDYDNGSNLQVIEVKKDSTVTKPENPTKEGYSFINWYLDDEVYDFSKKVEKNITLTAKWQGLPAGTFNSTPSTSTSESQNTSAENKSSSVNSSNNANQQTTNNISQSSTINNQVEEIKYCNVVIADAQGYTPHTFTVKCGNKLDMSTVCSSLLSDYNSSKYTIFESDCSKWTYKISTGTISDPLIDWDSMELYNINSAINNNLSIFYKSSLGCNDDGECGYAFN